MANSAIPTFRINQETDSDVLEPIRIQRYYII